MNVQALVTQTLKKAEVPVFFQRKPDSNKDRTYITFFFVNERGVGFSDDEETDTEYAVQVDVFSDGSLSALVNSVKRHMKEAGFRRTLAMDGFEDGINLYRKILRFKFMTEYQD